jgi:Flp pilus assembly protein TadD
MAQPSAVYLLKPFAVIATVSAALMLGACAQTGDSLEAGLLSSKGDASKVADASDSSAEPAAGKTELEKATDYWGKKYKAHPTDLDSGLSYAKNLKAMGERQQALAVIQQLAVFHGQDKKLASEYGRLALELEQISIAKTMLAIADDPASPDWRVISARGTVLAKEGKYREAIPLYERALTLSQDQTSVMNNLAMAYAMGGEAPRAEEMLRRIEAKGGSPKSRQNLALVLGLQGKFEEGRQIASKDIGAEGAASDAEYLKRMVKVEKAAAWSTSTKPSQAATKAVAQADADQPVAMPVAAPMTSATAGYVTDGQPPLRGMTP